MMLPGFKTVLANGVLFLGALSVNLGWIEVAPTPEQTAEFVNNVNAVLVFVTPFINIVLRKLTKTAIFSKE